MQKLDWAVLVAAVICIIGILGFVVTALGVPTSPTMPSQGEEIVREVRWSQNFQNDLREAVSGLTAEMMRRGCKEGAIMGFSKPDEPEVVVLVAICRDEK